MNGRKFSKGNQILLVCLGLAHVSILVMMVPHSRKYLSPKQTEIAGDLGFCWFKALIISHWVTGEFLVNSIREINIYDHHPENDGLIFCGQRFS